MNWRIGIDESGRGPVIGPLVYGCVALNTQFTNLLEKHFIKDSKKLSSTAREQAYAYLHSNKQYMHLNTEVLHAPDIDAKMLSQSLNRISYDMVVKLIIQSLRFIYKNDPAPDKIEVVLDTLSDNPETYAESYRGNTAIQNIIKKHFTKTKLTIQAYIGGDAIEKIISAASILAKETREIEIRKLTIAYGDFGSGYPADKRTISWIKKNYPAPANEICRTSWKTWKNIQSGLQ